MVTLIISYTSKILSFSDSDSYYFKEVILNTNFISQCHEGFFFYSNIGFKTHFKPVSSGLNCDTKGLCTAGRKDI